MHPKELLGRLRARNDARRKRGAAVIVALVVVGSSVFVGVGFASQSSDAERGDEPTPPTGLVELGSGSTTLTGAAAGDRAGWSVASAGDVNGDGIDDLLVAAPFGDAAGHDSGAVYLFYGPVDASDVSVAEADATFVGESAGDWAGYAVAGGDVNGDGRSDIVVGAPRHDGTAVDSGAVYVLDGANSPSGTIPLAEADAKLTGESEHDRAGWSVGVRDVAAADTPSVVVGAPTDRPNLQNGAAYVLSMNALAGGQDLAAAETKLVGQRNGDLAGWSVDWAGDVNGDGRSHVIVGARLHNATTGPEAGAAYLVPETERGTSNLAHADVKLVGAGSGDNAGFAVAGVGDVDGDGRDDVVVGAPLDDETGVNAGTAYLAFGSDSLSGVVNLASVGGMVHGEAPGDMLGWSVGGAGDLDADGLEDVLLGAPNHDGSGAAYLVYGRSAAGDLGAAKLAGERAGDLAGFAVAGAGDVDGNGASDVLVGAPRWDDHRDAGAAYLLRVPVAEERHAAGTTSPEVETPEREKTGTGTPARAETASQGTPTATHTRTEAKTQARSGTKTHTRTATTTATRTHERPTTTTSDGTTTREGRTTTEERPTDPPTTEPRTTTEKRTTDPRTTEPPTTTEERPTEPGGQTQQQSVSIFQNQCQVQEDGEQHQEQSQGISGGQDQSQVGDYAVVQFQSQHISVEQTQCQSQGDGSDNEQAQLQFLSIVFVQSQDQLDAAENAQHQDQSIDSEQDSSQNQDGDAQQQTQIQTFTVYFLQDQDQQAGGGASQQAQHQHVEIDQNQDQRQGDGTNQTQVQYQQVEVVYMDQEQIQDDQRQSQEQSVDAEQYQQQRQENGSSNQSQAESVEIEQNQSQEQYDDSANQTQSQSASVDQSQNQTQGGDVERTQNQSQSVEAAQNGTQSGGENQTQSQNQTIESSQNQTIENGSASQNASVDADQSQDQNQTGENNTQSLNASGSVDGSQSQNQAGTTTETTDGELSASPADETPDRTTTTEGESASVNSAAEGATEEQPTDEQTAEEPTTREPTTQEPATQEPATTPQESQTTVPSEAPTDDEATAESESSVESTDTETAEPPATTDDSVETESITEQESNAEGESVETETAETTTGAPTETQTNDDVTPTEATAS